MLQTLSHHFGGGLSFEKKTLKVVWSTNSQSSIAKIFDVFKRYPLLTSRKTCQLKHALACSENRAWAFHQQSRDFKYAMQPEIVQRCKSDFKPPSYFAPWISGFYEAEGCFRCTHRLSAYISQNDDWYLLNALKTYFNSHHKLSLVKDKRTLNLHYRLSLTGKPVLRNVVAHFEAYPLLGHKKLSYDLFHQKFKVKTHVS